MSEINKEGSSGIDSGDINLPQNYYNDLNKLPDEFKSLVRAFSSHFLEPDIREKYLNDPKKLGFLRDQFQHYGFNKEQVNIALKVLNLNPDNPEQTSIKK